MNHLKYWIPTSDTVEFHVFSIRAGLRHLVARVFNISSISLDKMKDHYYCNNISPGCKEVCFSDFQELLILVRTILTRAPPTDGSLEPFFQFELI